MPVSGCEPLLAVASGGKATLLVVGCDQGRAAVKDDAMAGAAPERTHAISFGRFKLVPGERLLTENGVPVELGGRTLDTLIALASRPNEVVGKRDLMALVWPDVIVEEGSLRFHVASLRKALGDGKEGARYIKTLTGQGYCFVAPIALSGSRDEDAPAVIAETPLDIFLPSRLARMVGREDSIRIVSGQLATSRFVTIVGSGGVGKTTVAVAVAHQLLKDFSGAVLFIDFGMLSDPAMVPVSMASMLGISIRSNDPTPGLLAHVRDKRILVILDNCEHVIEATANLAADLFRAAPRLHILATSREAMRVEGEQVHRLTPLGVPPDDPALTASVALTFPATQLFMERAAASGARMELGDADAAIVASICRKLDGVALAIELAAGRVAAYGLHQTAALLDQRLTLLWPGQRNAPPRQRTLQATLDWSYGLLSELERVVFRRLAVFVGYFTIEAALVVVTNTTVDQAHVFGAIDSLVAKSMVAARPAGAMMRYRLLETARAYALEISVDESERSELAARHAMHFQGRLEQTGADWSALSDAVERAPHLAGLGDARAALEWCFGVDGNTEIGVGLAAAAAPVFLAVSLFTECHRWSERALVALNDAARGGREEMHLQAALGLSLMFTHGESDAASMALERSLLIAEERCDPFNQLRLLGPLQMFHARIGDYKTALLYGNRASPLSRAVGDPAALALAHTLLGLALHLTGDQIGARGELEAALDHGPGSHRTTTTYLGFDGYHIGAAHLARTLWLQGYPDQALERARQTVKNAAAMDHPITLSVVQSWAISVFLWAGDLHSAGEHIKWFLSRAESHSLKPFLAVGRGFKGQLAIRQGDAIGGIEKLKGCLSELRAARYELKTTPFNLSIAQGLTAIGRISEGTALIDETIGAVKENGDHCYMPELLRTKGRLLLAMPQYRPDEAEACFLQSLELSRHQGARAWELRTAVDFAALLAVKGRSDSARILLQPVYETFAEGFETEDLQAADRLLATLA
jgi:predicted ATPase/DNA-binding winged helix-turn-helix (wHTH) protein